MNTDVDPAEADDPELVRAMRHDPAALEEFYRRHVRAVTAYARRRLVSGFRMAGWWTAATQVLASPLSTPALRSATLRLAAGDPTLEGAATVRSDRTRDQAGRAGVAVRVPYLYASTETLADLILDPATGAVWQRVVRSPAGHPGRTIMTIYG